jgi:hypothetical protein
MKTYTLVYLFGGKEHRAAFPARSAHWARLLGPLQLQAGAELLRVEPAE